MTDFSSLTASDNCFENFHVGDVWRHARGKTVTQNEAVTICHMVMNTADAHFNDHRMAGAWIGESVVFGGVTLSVVMGLAMQDTGEQVIAELGLDQLKFTGPVKHGDTLYAFSEVLKIEAAERDDAGVVLFRHYGVNQDAKLVFQGDRRVLMKRRAAR